VGRFIEVQSYEEIQQALTLKVGDCLCVHTSGGNVDEGLGVVESFGPLLDSVLGNNGEVLVPLGFPNRMLFFARRSGRAVITLPTGSPLQSNSLKRISVSVEG